MFIRQWLTINARGSVKLTKNEPKLLAMGVNEIKMKLEFRLPDALFKRPSLEAQITMPEGLVVEEVIKSETLLNAEDAIKSATGLDIKINVVKEEN